MRIGSLFSGIGGLDLGLERSIPGARVVWQVESDPFCRTILARYWPHAERFEDVTTVTANQLAAVDLIAGGFPCQDISDAGTRVGITGERSGLWSHYARIVRAHRPQFVVIENVSALRTRGMGTVLRDLAACGYDAQWDCIPASAIGAPHRRDRIFVVAWRVPDGDGDELRLGAERGTGRTQATDQRHAIAEQLGGPVANANRLSGRAGDHHEGDPGRGHAAGTGAEVMADSNGRRCQGERVKNWESVDGCPRGYEPDGSDLPIWPPAPDDLRAWNTVPANTQPTFCRVAHGVPHRMDRLRAVGNAVVPMVAEVVGLQLITIANREGIPI